MGDTNFQQFTVGKGFEDPKQDILNCWTPAGIGGAVDSPRNHEQQSPLPKLFCPTRSTFLPHPRRIADFTMLG